MNPEIDKILKAGRRLAKQTRKHQEKAQVTFFVTKALREAVYKKARENSFNVSDYLEKCLLSFIDFPIEKMTNRLQHFARKNASRTQFHNRLEYRQEYLDRMAEEGQSVEGQSDGTESQSVDGSDIPDSGIQSASDNEAATPPLFPLVSASDNEESNGI